MSMKRMLPVILLGLMAMGVTGCGSGAASWLKDSSPSADTSAEAKQKIDEPDAPSIAQDTPAADEYEQLGDTYVRQGNWTLALLQYDRALKSAPRHDRVRHKKYLLFLANGLHADAIAGFRSLVREQAHDASAWEGLGRSLLQAGQEAKAEEALRQAVQENRQLWRAHTLLGVLYDLRQEHDLAVSAYRAALELKPDHLELRNNLGRSYYLRGDYRKALEEFEFAQKGGYSEAAFHNNLGLALAKTGAYRDALAAFRLGGAEPQALSNLGIMYLDAGQASNAVVCFQKAIEVNPKFDQRANDQLTVAQSVLQQERTRRTLRPEQGTNVCS
jgi:Flp pilus assembly protein TadD